MQVNFDNLRRKLINNYNSLATKLNDELPSENDSDIRMSIENEMENLRQLISTLACIYIEGECDSMDDFDMIIFNGDVDDLEE